MVYNVNARSQKQARKGKYFRVWLNGVEVSRRSFYVDPRRGVVRCYKVNEAGLFYIDEATGEVAKEELRGRVEIRRVVPVNVDESVRFRNEPADA